jgi:hypothetical protein
MIIVDINGVKTVEYKISNANKIKSAQLIVTLPNGVVFNYPGVVNIKKEEIVVTIPNQEKIILNEVEGNCYLYVQDVQDRFYKLAEDTIQFQFRKVVELEFHEDYIITADHKEKSELVIDNKNVKLIPTKFGQVLVNVKKLKETTPS